MQLSVACATLGEHAHAFKELWRVGVGAHAIRAAIAAYIDRLKGEFSTGLILPTKHTVEKQTDAKAATAAKATPVDEPKQVGDDPLLSDHCRRPARPRRWTRARCA